MPAFAQDPEPTSVDSAKEVPVAPVPVTKNVELDISRFGIDQIIDNGFGVFGNPITNTVFYAPAFGEDVLMKEVGKDRSDQSFFDNPPFTLSYEKGESPSFGTVFEVYEDASGQMFVKYPSEEDVTFGSTINVDGFDVQVNKVGYNTEKDQLILSLVSAGGNEILEKLQLSNTAIQEGTSGDEIKSINVAYEKVVPVDANGKVKAGGFDFELKKSESSNYSFAEGKTYSFQVSQITFLPIVIIILLLGATFFTFYFGFVNIRKFGLAVNVVRGKYSDPNEAGEVSHFQALTAALSGTVGLGNIAGVAIAISIGGAGATFWMIIAGLLGMSSKFAECTLGVKYRQIDADGEVSGGPMYYLSQGLKEKGLGGLGRIFAIFFAVMCIGGSFGGGNMFQVNQAYKQFVNVSHLDVSGWIFGIVMAALVAVVIIGGIKSIASVTDKIVPFMVGIYVAAALIIIGLNLGEVPRAFSEIFAGAFAPTAVAGGFIGVLIQGFRRAAFSNEAGVGSASIAHSAVKTNNPASEGIVALLEPFIDTVVVCTMTALVIVITDNHLDPNASDGVVLTSRAFASQIPFADYILAIAVILFAFSTMITWSYYGLKAWTYLFGDSNVADITYKVLFCTFVVIGSAATLGSVTGFSDAMIFAMSVPNIIGVVILSPVVKEELQKYIGKIKSGEIVRVK
ncbi:MAG: alanine/glycine:cation symporter family protein [Bacteroidota bacterium]